MITEEELRIMLEEEMREMFERDLIWGVHLSEESKKKYKYGRD